MSNTLRKVVNPFRAPSEEFEDKHFSSQYFYFNEWKKGFFTIYGKKDLDSNTKKSPLLNLLTDPFIQTAELFGGIVEHKEKGKANIGLLDFANPLIMLTLLNIQLTNFLRSKMRQYSDENSKKLAILFRVLNVAHLFIIRLPIGALAYATTLVWDLLKAVVAAVAVTVSSAVWAPVRFYQMRKATSSSSLETPLMDDKKDDKKGSTPLEL